VSATLEAARRNAAMRISSPVETMIARGGRKHEPIVYVGPVDHGRLEAFLWGATLGAGVTAALVVAVLLWPVAS
jgi:hypothetical protein